MNIFFVVVVPNGWPFLISFLVRKSHVRGTFAYTCVPQKHEFHRSRASSVWPRAVATSCSARRHGTAAFSRSTPSRVFGEQGSGSWWFVRGGLYHITLLQLAGCNRIPASDGTIREQ